MHTVIRILGGGSPETVDRLLAACAQAQQRQIRRTGTAVWRLSGPVDRLRLFRELLPLTRSEGVILALSQRDVPRRAMLFDLDSTITACEFLDALAEETGLGDQIRPATRAAMEGERDFAASYRERVAQFAGTPVGQIEALIERLPLAEGAAELFGALREKRLPTAIITGGYARVGRAIQQRIGADALYATELEECDGRLTGRVAGPLVDAAAKVAALDDFCARRGLQRSECTAVGDGANDLPLLEAAGCGILYCASPAHAGRSESLLRLLEG